MDKDTIVNAVGTSHDIHLLKIDNREDELVTRVNSWCTHLVDKVSELRAAGGVSASSMAREEREEQELCGKKRESKTTGFSAEDCTLPSHVLHLSSHSVQGVPEHTHTLTADRSTGVGFLSDLTHWNE